MSKLDRGDMYSPKKTGTKLNSLIDACDDDDEALARFRRLSDEAIRWAKGTGVDASGAEAGVALTAADGLPIPVGTIVSGVMTANTTHPVLMETAYRGSILTVNSLNQLTTNFAGQGFAVVLLNRDSL